MESYDCSGASKATLNIIIIQELDICYPFWIYNLQNMILMEFILYKTYFPQEKTVTMVQGGTRVLVKILFESWNKANDNFATTRYGKAFRTSNP